MSKPPATTEPASITTLFIPRDLAARLAEMGRNVNTQDNRITSDPIFLVQEKRRFLGDADADDSYVWYNRHWDQVDAELAAQLDQWEEENSGDLTGYTKYYYREVYVTVQPFFTEAEAQRYIDSNAHRMSEPRIYVDSAYRNREWQTIREFLSQIGGAL